MEKWKKSGLSKRAYCMQYDVSESSFNAWNREIDLRDREKGTSKHRVVQGETVVASNPVVPLRLLPDGSPIISRNAPPALIEETATHVEVIVPGGAIIRVIENSDLKLVSQLLQSLKD